MDDNRDDRAIGQMVTALAEPRTPPPDALDRVAANAAQARRRQRLHRGTALVATVAVIALAVGLGVSRAGHQQPQPTAPHDSGVMSVDGEGRLFGLYVKLTYAAPRHLLSGVFLAEGQTFDGSFYTPEEDDELVPSIAVGPSGVVELTAVITPDCERNAERPVALVRSRLPTEPVLALRIRADATAWASYQEQRAAWCSVPAHVDVRRTVKRDGKFLAFTLEITNTTNHSIKVVVARLQDEGTTWPRTAVTVGPQGSGLLPVHALGDQGGPNPLHHLRLTADGVPIHPQLGY